MLADPGGAVDRPQPSPGRVRLDRGVPRPVPGVHGARPRSCTALPRILRENGYVTGGFGKWHLTPDNVQGAAGPFDHWPQSWGFDHWWGFLSGAAGQYDPIITQDNTTLGVQEGKDGKPYYFPDDLTDKAVEWLHAVRAQDAQKPWFMYYSTGCAHAPHHVAKEWADKYKGKFDAGLGQVPRADVRASEEARRHPAGHGADRAAGSAPRLGLADDAEKKLYTRQMEVYAGFQENADWNVGRLLDAIEEMGDLDNTLIFYIWGDNGASMEGTVTGSFNEMTFLNGVVLEPEQQLKLIEQYGGIDALGGDHTAPHVAAAWAHAGQHAVPVGQADGEPPRRDAQPDGRRLAGADQGAGDLRAQFTHCIDIGPTVLEAAGIPEPKLVDGIEQEPMDGTSFLYTFDDANAQERHTVQYFEIVGSRAIYKDGWWAARSWTGSPGTSRPRRSEAFAPGGVRPEKDVLGAVLPARRLLAGAEIAAEHPDKLEELQELCWQEAERNRVLPLMGGISVFFGILPPLPTITRFTFTGDVQNVQRGMVPRILGRSYAIEAELSPGRRCRGSDRRQRRLHRRVRAMGRRQGTAAPHLLVPGGRDLQASVHGKIPTGEVTVKMLFEADENKPGTGGNVTLWANDKQIGEGRIDRPFRSRSRPTRAWTSAATTASSSTSTTRTRLRTRSPAP